MPLPNARLIKRALIRSNAFRTGKVAKLRRSLPNRPSLDCTALKKVDIDDSLFDFSNGVFPDPLSTLTTGYQFDCAVPNGPGSELFAPNVERFPHDVSLLYPVDLTTLLPPSENRPSRIDNMLFYFKRIGFQIDVPTESSV